MGRLAAMLLTTLLVGCGHARAPFDGSDARRLAATAPAAAGWSWPANPSPPKWDTSAATPTTDPLLTVYRQRTAHLVSLGEAFKKWQDANKLANLDIEVFENAEDAHDALAPFDALSLGWAKRSGRVLGTTKPKGIGDEAWAMSVAGNGREATVHWRRRNLVFEAHVHCFGRCPADVDSAARAWAAAIDDVTRE
jgi:hypothetical protein